jgi:hypothetical protein
MFFACFFAARWLWEQAKLHLKTARWPATSDITEAAPIPYAYVFVHSGEGKITVTRVSSDGGFEVRLLPFAWLLRRIFRRCWICPGV